MRTASARLLLGCLLAAGVLLAGLSPAAAEYPPGPVDHLQVATSGGTIGLSDGGYAPGSKVVVRPGSADAQVATPRAARADEHGRFELDVPVPDLAGGAELRYVAEGVGPDGDAVSSEFTINVLLPGETDEPSPSAAAPVASDEVDGAGAPGPALWALLAAALAGFAGTSLLVRRRDGRG